MKNRKASRKIRYWFKNKNTLHFKYSWNSHLFLSRRHFSKLFPCTNPFFFSSRNISDVVNVFLPGAKNKPHSQSILGIKIVTIEIVTRILERNVGALWFGENTFSPPLNAMFIWGIMPKALLYWKTKNPVTDGIGEFKVKGNTSVYH